jgi:hypothetical protein
VVIAQRPNLPIIVWVVFGLVSKIVPTGWPKTSTSFISTAALIVWASLELGWGESYFRRTLGATVLAVVLLRLWL